MTWVTCPNPVRPAAVVRVVTDFDRHPPAHPLPPLGRRSVLGMLLATAALTVAGIGQAVAGGPPQDCSERVPVQVDRDYGASVVITYVGAPSPWWFQPEPVHRVWPHRG